MMTILAVSRETVAALATSRATNDYSEVESTAIITHRPRAAGANKFGERDAKTGGAQHPTRPQFQIEFVYGRYASGSWATPFTSMMKWTWGPVDIPVLPTGPITSPLAIESPAETQGVSAMCP